jgi:hypothetical protein
MKPGDKGYWKWRANTGRPKSIKSPEQLWKFACEYFERESEPAVRQDFIRSGPQAGMIVEMDQMKPFIWEGLEDYLNEKKIIIDLQDYRYNTGGRYEAFKGVIRAITKVMYARNIKGASMNFLHNNIIARYHGLSESSKVELKKEQPLFGDVEDE